MAPRDRAIQCYLLICGDLRECRWLVVEVVRWLLRKRKGKKGSRLGGSSTFQSARKGKGEIGGLRETGRESQFQRRCIESE